MKKILAGGVMTVSTLLSSAYGAPLCKRAAIRVAREYSRNASTITSVAILPSKSYLESYRIALTDSQNEESEVIDVTLMKSDCSVVSVIPRI
jgi:hypothetical protein